MDNGATSNGITADETEAFLQSGSPSCGLPELRSRKTFTPSPSPLAKGSIGSFFKRQVEKKAGGSEKKKKRSLEVVDLIDLVDSDDEEGEKEEEKKKKKKKEGEVSFAGCAAAAERSPRTRRLRTTATYLRAKDARRRCLRAHYRIYANTRLPGYLIRLLRVHV